MTVNERGGGSKKEEPVVQNFGQRFTKLLEKDNEKRKRILYLYKFRVTGIFFFRRTVGGG